MSKVVKLVKVQVMPFFIVEDENGFISSDVNLKDPIQVFASELADLQKKIQEAQDRVATHVFTAKS